MEIIIHDDASTDGTTNIVRWYKEKYPEVIKVVFQTKNQWSEGKKPFRYIKPLASGEYVALCEGDDKWILETKLQDQYLLMKKNPHYSMCGAKAKIVKITKTGNEVNLGLLGPIKKKQEYTIHDALSSYFLHTNTYMLKNGLVENPPWLDEIVNIDEAIIALHAEKGPIGFVDKTVSVYRLHCGGMWSSMDIEKRFWLNMQTCEKLNEHFGFKYQKIIRRRQCKIAQEVALQLNETGNQKLAKKTILKVVTRVFWCVPFNSLLVLFRIYADKAFKLYFKISIKISIRTRIKGLVRFFKNQK